MTTEETKFYLLNFNLKLNKIVKFKKDFIFWFSLELFTKYFSLVSFEFLFGRRWLREVDDPFDDPAGQDD